VFLSEGRFSELRPIGLYQGCRALTFALARLSCILLFTDAARVPVVCIVLEGGPNTLETVRSAVEKGTPAVIIKVSQVLFVIMCIIWFIFVTLSRSINQSINQGLPM